MSTEQTEVNQPIIIKPGETIVIQSSKPMGEVEKYKVARWLQRKFPDNPVILLPAELQIVVAQPENSPLE